MRTDTSDRDRNDICTCYTTNTRLVPTELKLVTTLDGAKRAIDTLLPNNGRFVKLCKVYSMSKIEYSNESIVILRNSQGVELRDIRTVDDNEVAANQIVEQVRNLANDPESAIACFDG